MKKCKKIVMKIVKILNLEYLIRKLKKKKKNYE